MDSSILLSWIIILVTSFALASIMWRFRKDSPQLGGENFIPVALKRRLSEWFHIVSIILLFGALLSVTQEKFFAKTPQTGKEIYLIIDTSRSMGVEDVSQWWEVFISRLEAEKIMAKALVRAFPLNSYGLISLSDQSQVIAPITSDNEVILEFIDSLTIDKTQGKPTNMQTAIDLASRRFVDADTEHSIIIFSDGGEAWDGEVIPPTHSRIYALIFGTLEWGGMVTGYDMFHNPIYINRNGSVVKSKRYDERLISLTKATGGASVIFESVSENRVPFADFLASQSPNADREHTEFPRSYLLSCVAFIIFLISLLIPPYKNKDTGSKAV